MDDSDEWKAAALASVAVMVHELICLRSPWKRVPWRRLVRAGGEESSPMDVLMEEIEGAAARLVAPPSWAVRRRRTRYPAPRICAKGYEEEPARASPATPLEFPAGSGASASDGEAKPATSEANRQAGPADGGGTTKAATRGRRSPALTKVPEERPIGRTGKKKTLQELQGEEASLIEEGLVLKKEIMALKRKLEALAEDNKRLKQMKLSPLPLPTPIVASKEAAVGQEVQSGGCTDLPDLNEPWLVEDLS